MRRAHLGLAAVLLGLLAAGCGGGTQVSAETSAVQVIRGWTNSLRAGDITRAAGYFALPSTMENGGFLEIRTRAQAYAANEGLSCGSKLLSAAKHGKYIVAVFKLTNRRGPDAGCGSGAGATASVYFVIKHDRIVDWLRAPDLPPTNTVPSTPTVSQAPTPVI
jgi:hypothetical protein